MSNRFWVARAIAHGGGALLACGAPFNQAAAQRVELLTFDAPAAEEASPGVEPSSLEPALITSFAEQSLPVVPMAPPPSFIRVPSWMRPAAAHSLFAATWPELPAGCNPLPYRPRRDLALATEARRARLFPIVALAACEAGVPVGLFDALVVQESRYDMTAVSPKGAVGLSQLMPATARYLAVANPFDALSNLRGGARYLREQLTTFGRVDLALAAYNAGPGRVRARWAVPRISETLGYVSSVTRGWHLSVVREAALLDFRADAAATATRTPTSGRTARVFSFSGAD